MTFVVPEHVAIIMDGNGRWAKQRYLPRLAGHQQGAEALREVVKAAATLGVKILTVFAFSSENWKRSPEEVRGLMHLLKRSLRKEAPKLNENNVRLRLVGDIAGLSVELQQEVATAELMTASNLGLQLNVAVNYGGRWDIVHAVQQVAQEVYAGKLLPEHITEAHLAPYLALAEVPEPDLLIRTSGEKRLSNFLLWQLAYTELYFSEKLWPDFGEPDLKVAIAEYQQRKRRFGTTQQVLATQQSMVG